MKILLVSTPFILHDMPPAGIGALKAILNQNNYKTDVCHLSLHLESIIGESAYFYLTDNPWSAEFVYSACLFTQKKRVAKLKHIFKQRLKNNDDYCFPKKFQNFDRLIKEIKSFNKIVENSIFKQKYDVVGFSINGNQLLASIYFAQKYKAQHPDTKIILGGDACLGEVGKSYLSAFPWIDYVVHGEGEKTLLKILNRLKKNTGSQIAGCSYRLENQIISQPFKEPIKTLNKLPIPDHSDFFNEIKNRKAVLPKLYLPIEMARGCWWNKCAFCNLSYSRQGKRKKFSPKHILKTLEHHSEQYQELNYLCTDVVEYRPLIKLLKTIQKSKKQFEFFMEARVSIKYDELKELKKTGLTEIQFGIESLSTCLLKKMNKGSTAIENIKALKFAKELNIKTSYNLITHFPGETKSDYKTTLKNIKISWHLTYDFFESYFSLDFGSPMQLHPHKYGLKKLKPHHNYKFLFPSEIYNKLHFISWNFETSKPVQGSYHKNLEKEGFQNDHEPKLTYRNGENFILITDTRYEEKPTQYHLTSLTKDIYLYCHDIKSFSQIQKQLSKISQKSLTKELNQLCRQKLMFKEGDRYLSLATAEVIK